MTTIETVDMQSPPVWRSARRSASRRRPVDRDMLLGAHRAAAIDDHCDFVAAARRDPDPSASFLRLEPVGLGYRS